MDPEQLAALMAGQDVAPGADPAGGELAGGAVGPYTAPPVDWAPGITDMPAEGLPLSTPTIDPMLGVELTDKQRKLVKKGLVAPVPTAPATKPATQPEATVPASVSAGTKNAVSESRAGFDEDVFARVDKASGGNEWERESRQLDTQVAGESVKAARDVAAAEQKFLADETALTSAQMAQESQQREEQANLQLQLQQKLTTVANETEAEIKQRMAQWEIEKQEFSRLVAMNPVSEMYSGAGGVGMLLSKAAGSYLTAMGVQNDLGAQVDKWVDHAQQFHKQRIEGKTRAMDATSAMIDKIWENSASETEARVKIAQVGLAAIDSQIEAEKLKTSSKLKLAHLNLAQANVRMKLAETQRSIVTDLIKNVTQTRLSEANRRQAIASAGHLATQTRIAKEEWAARREQMKAASAVLPDNVIEVIGEDGRIRLNEVPTRFSDAERKKYREMGAAAHTVINQSRELRALMAANKGQYGTLDRLLTATTPEGAKARELMHSIMIGRKVIESGAAAPESEMRSYRERSGLVGGSVDLFQQSMKELLGKASPQVFSEAFIDTTVKSAVTSYQSSIPGVPADMNNPAIRNAQERYDAAMAGRDYVAPRQTVALGGATTSDVKGYIASAKSAVANLGNAHGDTVDAANNIGMAAQRLTKAYQTLGAQLAQLPPGSPAYREAANEMERIRLAAGELRGYAMKAGYELDSRRIEIGSYVGGDAPRDNVRDNVGGYAVDTATRQRNAKPALDKIGVATNTIGATVNLLEWSESKE